MSGVGRGAKVLPAELVDYFIWAAAAGNVAFPNRPKCSVPYRISWKHYNTHYWMIVDICKCRLLERIFF